MKKVLQEKSREPNSPDGGGDGLPEGLWKGSAVEIFSRKFCR
jgi:hypothetical protein